MAELKPGWQRVKFGEVGASTKKEDRFLDPARHQRLHPPHQRQAGGGAAAFQGQPHGRQSIKKLRPTRRQTPPAAPTTGKAQPTINARTHATTLAAKGRHNPSVLPRAVPMVEAMVALVLADHLLRQRGQCSLW